MNREDLIKSLSDSMGASHVSYDRAMNLMREYGEKKTIHPEVAQIALEAMQYMKENRRNFVFEDGTLYVDGKPERRLF